MSRLRALIGAKPCDLRPIRAYLDGSDPATRLTEIRALRRDDQSRLFAAAEGFMAVSLDDIVGADRAPMEEVVHHGKNSLPVFNRFAKVFTRPHQANRPELWGYNRTGSFIEAVVGPGYFVAYPHSVEGEVLVDYLRVPPARPEHWPEILPNSARLSRLVYHRTQDILRGVSKHVFIGRATKDDKPLAAWFALCRSDGPERDR